MSEIEESSADDEASLAGKKSANGLARPPPMKTITMEAIGSCKDSKGMSVPAIKKYIADKYPAFEENRISGRLQNALLKCLSDRQIVHTSKSKGAPKEGPDGTRQASAGVLMGRYKLNTKTTKATSGARKGEKKKKKKKKESVDGADEPASEKDNTEKSIKTGKDGKKKTEKSIKKGKVVKDLMGVQKKKKVVSTASADEPTGSSAEGQRTGGSKSGTKKLTSKIARLSMHKVKAKVGQSRRKSTQVLKKKTKSENPSEKKENKKESSSEKVKKSKKVAIESTSTEAEASKPSTSRSKKTTSKSSDPVTSPSQIHAKKAAKTSSKIKLTK